MAEILKDLEDASIGLLAIITGLRDGWVVPLTERGLPSGSVLSYLQENLETDVRELQGLDLGDRKERFLNAYRLLTEGIWEYSQIDSSELAKVVAEGVVKVPEIGEITGVMEVLKLQELRDEGNSLLRLSKGLEEFLDNYLGKAYPSSVRSGISIDTQRFKELRPYVAKLIFCVEDYRLNCATSGDSLVHLCNGSQRLIEMARLENYPY